MRILVVGAGALGGYFGGRLKDAGRDVTFLVRPRRAEQLAKTGLVIRSPRGDANIPQPATILAENLRAPFDLILLSCKAYDLQSAMDSFAPAVGANTAILPLLNGMKHMDLLAARFGADAMLGGQCVISATLDPQGHVLHLNDLHFVSYGEQDGSKSARATAIAAAFSGARFESQLSTTIMQEMWEKWAIIAAVAGSPACCAAQSATSWPPTPANCRSIYTRSAARSPRLTALRRVSARASAASACSRHPARHLPPRCYATSNATRRSKPIT